MIVTCKCYETVEVTQYPCTAWQRLALEVSSREIKLAVAMLGLLVRQRKRGTL